MARSLGGIQQRRLCECTGKVWGSLQSIFCYPKVPICLLLLKARHSHVTPLPCAMSKYVSGVFRRLRDQPKGIRSYWVARTIGA